MLKAKAKNIALEKLLLGDLEKKRSDSDPTGNTGTRTTQSTTDALTEEYTLTEGESGYSEVYTPVADEEYTLTEGEAGYTETYDVVEDYDVDVEETYEVEEEYTITTTTPGTPSSTSTVTATATRVQE